MYYSIRISFSEYSLCNPIAWPKAVRGMASGSSIRSRSLEDQKKGRRVNNFSSGINYQ